LNVIVVFFTLQVSTRDRELVISLGENFHLHNFLRVSPGHKHIPDLRCTDYLLVVIEIVAQLGNENLPFKLKDTTPWMCTIITFCILR
jgi:hypothetical protein